jgi:hypothetical protein
MCYKPHPGDQDIPSGGKWSPDPRHRVS